ncbi:MAG: hypothetical protein A2104_03860 [Candidatus Melainabacteria bacterium GWF2_32_7]|nr:MAG: hypothetical protein A2104_03860 [Candidatus Melainabacteria bacterium GWF2_32_7]
MKKIISKNIIYYSVTLLLLIVFGLVKFVGPEINKINDYKKKIKETESKLIAYRNKVESESLQQQNISKNIAVPVIIYSSPYPGLDTENASVELVDQIIEMIRITQNRIVEISFSIKPADSASPANILSLNMSLNSSYTNFQNFLHKIYTWKYLAAIKDITISPEQGDPNNLTAKIVVDLYINK